MKKKIGIALLIAILALVVFSCELINLDIDSNEKFVFSFIKNRPTSYLAEDGTIELLSDNINDIDSIEWTKQGSSFKSLDVNIINLSSGYYFYKIIDINGNNYVDSIFLASLDTIKPLEYFPSYPGSWWIYSNNDTIKCSDIYYKVPLYSYGIFSPNTELNIEDSLYVVKANGVSCFDSWSATPFKRNEIGIFGYTYLYPVSNYDASRAQFFCKDQDCSFIVSDLPAGKYAWTDCAKIVNDTTIVINNKIYPNTQVMRKVIMNAGGYGFKNFYLYYFSKDIGIIKCERLLDLAENTYITEYEIVNYEINKP